MVAVFDRRTFIVAGTEYRRRSLQRMVISQVAALFFVAGGIAILTQGIAGVYAFVPAVICSYLIALLDAWVLLVEINR